MSESNVQQNNQNTKNTKKIPTTFFESGNPSTWSWPEWVFLGGIAIVIIIIIVMISNAIRKSQRKKELQKFIQGTNVAGTPGRQALYGAIQQPPQQQQLQKQRQVPPPPQQQLQKQRLLPPPPQQQVPTFGYEPIPTGMRGQGQYVRSPATSSGSESQYGVIPSPRYQQLVPKIGTSYDSIPGNPYGSVPQRQPVQYSALPPNIQRSQ